MSLMVQQCGLNSYPLREPNSSVSKVEQPSIERIIRQMCSFCNKIYNEDELNGQYFHEVCDCITYDENNNNYNFWHECDEDYYTGNIMEIKYCPVCGRRLSDG